MSSVVEKNENLSSIESNFIVFVVRREFVMTTTKIVIVKKCAKFEKRITICSRFVKLLIFLIIIENCSHLNAAVVVENQKPFEINKGDDDDDIIENENNDDDRFIFTTMRC